MSSDKNQGEGNRDAAREYNEDTKDFVKEGKVKDSAKDAANVSRSEKEKLEKAEDKGRDRAKEFDPQVKR